MPHDRRTASQGQILDIRAQTKIGTRLNGIDTAINLFDNLVTPRIDHIEIVTSATSHGVITSTIIQSVVTFAT
ncbi:hypothetical protein ABFT82_06335 [Pseudomonas anguilliseptica]